MASDQNLTGLSIKEILFAGIEATKNLQQNTSAYASGKKDEDLQQLLQTYASHFGMIHKIFLRLKDAIELAPTAEQILEKLIERFKISYEGQNEKYEQSLQEAKNMQGRAIGAEQKAKADEARDFHNLSMGTMHCVALAKDVLAKLQGGKAVLPERPTAEQVLQEIEDAHTKEKEAKEEALKNSKATSKDGQDAKVSKFFFEIAERHDIRATVLKELFEQLQAQTQQP